MIDIYTVKSNNIIYNLDNIDDINKIFLFEIEESDYLYLKDVINLYSKLINKELDEYSDAILTKKNIKLLKDILNLCFFYTKNNIFFKYIKLFDSFIQNKEYDMILWIGD